MDNNCAQTWNEANPWWAVDLGAALYVLGVFFSPAERKTGVTIFHFFILTMYD